jgi:protoheme IX farnesyltransferase
MNRAAPEILAPLEVAEELPEHGLLSDLMTLTKARLSLLVVITTFVGFCMASGPQLDWLLLFNAILGTTLAAAAAAVLNQFTESNVDRLMERTRHRPLPSGRMKPAAALALGLALTVVGVGYLWFTTNAMSAYLAAATVVIYLLFYTPLKRKTSFCTIVGAVSGAIPPVIGWTAARPSIDTGAWVLFGILFAWQMPHFLAIAWMYRDEYAQAGFVMLKRDDACGVITGLTSLAFTVALALVAVSAYYVGLNTWVYFVCAVLLNGAMLYFAVQFLLQRNRQSARQLFFASIVFLPLLLGVMVFTKA